MKRPTKTVPLGPALDTPDEELELLALMMPADVEAAKADDHWGKLGAALLAAGLVGALYTWRPERGPAGMFYNARTGRVISTMTVRRELDRYLASYAPTARQLAGQLRSGNITLAQWELEMRRHVRNIHLNAVAFERGGWAQMTIADFQRAGQIVRDEFGYLKKFGLEIADGTQRMDGTLDWRANLYTQSGRTTFYESKQANLKPELTHVRSIRTARDSCPDCRDLDHKWFKLHDPAYMLPGRRQCGRNCACYEEYGAFGDDGELVGTGAT